MASDSPHAPDLSLADRVRLVADTYPERSLEYKLLQCGADLLEDHPDAGPVRKPAGTSRDDSR